MNRYREFLILVGLCCLGFGQTLFYPPVYDDVEFIARNPITYDPLAVLNIFSSTYTGLRRADITYRPLTVWSFALNRGFNTLLGLDPMSPASFHLLNLALHALVTCLVYLFFVELKRSKRESFWTAALFSLLPIHIEAVTGIVGRAELFAAALGLLFLICHLKNKAPLGGVFYLCAMFGKESAITFFPLAVFLDITLGVSRSRPLVYSKKRFPRFRWQKPYSWYLASMLIWLGIRTVVISGQPYILAFVDNPTIAVGPVIRFFSACRYQLEYLQRTLLPYRLASDSSYNQIPLIHSPWNPFVLSFLMIFGLIGFLAWKHRKKEPFYLSLFGFYCISFSITSNFFFSIGSVVGERFAYTPSIAICAALPALLAHFFRKTPEFVGKILSSFVLLYGAVTIHQNLTWKDELTFFGTQVEVSPHSAKAHYNYGSILAKAGRDPEAINEYEKAIAIFPYYSEPFYNMGNALVRLKAPAEKVINAYENTLKYDRYHQGAMGNLLIYLRGANRFEEAEKVAQRLKSINPMHPALNRFP